MENEFISIILAKLGKENLLQGNEDASAIDLSNIPFDSLVINTDSMSWSSDALPPNISLRNFSKKLVSITVSDVIAKGATPKYFLSTISTPTSYGRAELDEIFLGMEEGCKYYELSYIGGDLGNSKELVITGIVLGFVEKHNLLKRSNAQENDLVCSTGYFGYTGLGYQLYLQNNEMIKKETSLHNKINQKLANPKARIDYLPFLKSYANAVIDSSDGLFQSLFHICQESNLGIDLELIPIDPELIKNKNLKLEFLEEVALYGGEEFELIFTISLKNYELFLNNLPKSYFQPVILGKVTSGTPKIILKNKELKFSQEKSWDSIKGFL